MSFSINTTRASIWKHVKTQYLALAAGAALALSAAIGFGAWEGSGGTGASTTGKPSTVSLGRATQTPLLTIYLVDSREQAEHVRNLDVQAQSLRYEYNIPEPPVTSTVLVVDSPEAEARAGAVIAAWYSDAGVSDAFVVKTVDLRDR